MTTPTKPEKSNRAPRRREAAKGGWLGGKAPPLLDVALASGPTFVPSRLRGALWLLLLAAGSAGAQEMVGLPDGDVMRVHVLEKRPFTEAGRWELSLFGMTQVNPKFTVHAGVSAELAYHLRENLAAQL